MSQALISLKNITKSYKMGDTTYQALKGISFDVQKGEMVAIMGASGSGKSTTMHILGLLDGYESGEYMLNGKLAKGLTPDEAAALRNLEIGFVFQSFNLLPRTTVYKNVELPLLYKQIPINQREKMVMDSLESVGLKDKAQNRSNQISGGQVQRVAIARAMVGNPNLILADEPTGNLDSKTSLNIMQLFQDLNQQGKTIILITHEQEIANFCKRIITLKDGEIIEDKINKDFHIIK